MYGSANLGLWHILGNNCSFAMYLGARLPEGVYGVFEFHQHYFKVDILTCEFSNKKKFKTIQFWS